MGRLPPPSFVVVVFHIVLLQVERAMSRRRWNRMDIMEKRRERVTKSATGNLFLLVASNGNSEFDDKMNGTLDGLLRVAECRG
jgi:hypothetical protein